MYGTVAKLNVKPGHLEEFKALSEEWTQARKPEVKGAQNSYMFQLDKDSNQLILVAIFENKALYQANADDPDQDKFYQRWRELLVDDPEWNDGEVIVQM
jgi:quinol monooxygenase YgiN